LRAFSVFADHLNFTRAAEELLLSQPALHVKVQKLAAGMGGALYVKEGRSLHLTELGRSVVTLATELEARLDKFLDAVAQPSEAPLVLAAGTGAHRWIVQGAVRSLIQRGHKLRLLSADHDHTVAAVRDGSADVGVTVLRSIPRGMGSVELACYPQVVVVPVDHRLARLRAVRLADLDGEALVMSPVGRPQREALDKAARREGVVLQVSAEAEGWAQMLDFVASEVGICVVNGCVLPSEGSVTRPIEDLPAVCYSALFRTPARHDPAVQRLLEALQAGAP
jgi:DNA-binding transcriptional LysR family regulator